MVAGERSVELLAMGRVIDAHGLRGELKLRPYNEESSLLDEVSDFFLRRGDGPTEAIRVTRVRRTPKAWILQVDGLADRTAAEARKGCELLVDPELLPETEDDEVYYHQLEGMAAVDTEQRPLGTVERIFYNGAHDILVLRDGKRERLVPFVDALVVDVDLDAGTLTLDPPAGLLDD